MGQIARKSSLHVIVDNTPSIAPDFTFTCNGPIAKLYGEAMGKYVHKILYYCNLNRGNGGEFNTIISRNKLAEALNRSSSSVDTYTRIARKEGLFNFTRFYQEGAQPRNKITPTDKLMSLIEGRSPVLPTLINCAPNAQKLSVQRTETKNIVYNDIYNKYKKNNTCIRERKPLEPSEDVFFDDSEKTKAQEAPPAPPPADPESIPHPIPTPTQPQPQPLQAQELSKEQKREAYEKFMEIYPLDSGTEKERKIAFLGPLRELGVEELLFRTEKYIEMYEKAKKAGKFLTGMLGPVRFLQEGYKSKTLMEFIDLHKQPLALDPMAMDQFIECLQENNPKSREVLSFLARDIGVSAFKSWFEEDFSIEKIEGRFAHFKAKNLFYGNIIQTRHSSALIKALQAVYPEVNALVFIKP